MKKFSLVGPQNRYFSFYLKTVSEKYEGISLKWKDNIKVLQKQDRLMCM
jgi:hypothetical protein